MTANPVPGRPDFERIALLLQGGGALGSYQAGVYQALAEAHLHPECVAGISIGALNSAIIAGNPPEKRVEALRLADAFRARVIDATTESFVFEITGKSDKVEQFIALMLPLGLVEVSRTGIAAIARGPEGM